jgi:hypothetical protein
VRWIAACRRRRVEDSPKVQRVGVGIAHQVHQLALLPLPSGSAGSPRGSLRRHDFQLRPQVVRSITKTATGVGHTNSPHHVGVRRGLSERAQSS